MTQLDFSDLLTEEQTAERLGASLATLARWRSDNTGPAWHDFGRRGLRYLPAEVERFARMRNRRPGPSPDGSAHVVPTGFDSRKAEAHSVREVSMVLPWPPSVNNLYVNTKSGRVLSPRGRAYKSKTASVAKAVMRGRILQGPVSVRMDFFPPDRRRRDLDNLLKAVLDSLTEGGVWEDDSQVVSLAANMMDPGPAGARVVLRAEERRAV